VKILTLTQPWATLVAHTWETPPPALTLFDLPLADESGHVTQLLATGERLPELL
jgi:hypothetical protein